MMDKYHFGSISNGESFVLTGVSTNYFFDMAYKEWAEAVIKKYLDENGGSIFEFIKMSVTFDFDVIAEMRFDEECDMWTIKGATIPIGGNEYRIVGKTELYSDGINNE